ncbi:GAF domain-containing protein [Nocardia sp. NBC_01499]|uniref:GAF domain-containing protein n=1 Tax=Nocardia sp. NBC_01499 TaxID=2903597 RepID=UPI0038670BE9
MNITDYEEALRSTVRLARLSFSSAAASVFLYREDRNAFVFEAASGAGEDQIIGMEVPAGKGIVGWVADSGEPIVVREVSSDSRFDLHTASATGYIPDVIMAIPLIRRGDIVGVMEVLDPVAELDDIVALEMLSELANQAVLILSMVPREFSPDFAQRAAATREFAELLDRIPDDKVSEVSGMIAAVAAVIL